MQSGIERVGVATDIEPNADAMHAWHVGRSSFH